MNKQLITFLTVGLSNITIQSIIVFCLVEYYTWQAFLANLIGFFVANCTSFIGHNYITFPNSGKTLSSRYISFLTLSLFALVLNQSIFYCVVNIYHLSYFIALALVMTLVPCCTYYINKKIIFCA